MDYEKLAELLFPNIKKRPEDYLKQYPKRDLKEGAYVTRFAPSPTGYLHIGGVYQATAGLFFAKKSGGVFYLRLEDTDAKREVAGAANIIYPALKEFGVEPMEGFISYDNGVETSKGEYGPYVQSRRKEIYQCFAKELVRQGKAYPCFCEGDDDDENEGLDYRKQQKALGLQIGYYGSWAKCRNLTLEQVEENLKAGKPFKIRIKADGDGQQRIIFKDKLRGNINMPKNFIDYVILKSDGSALYHLAHLVDDTLMHTSLVMRDESWLPSAPLHQQLFEYMNLPMPEYIHTAQIMTVDKETGNTRKISKRYDKWADSRWFIEKGYPSETIIEYLLNLLNSNFEQWRKENPNASVYDFEISEDKMSKSGAMFDLVKLEDISKTVISKFSAEKVYNLTLKWAETYRPKFAKELKEHKEFALKMFNIERETPKPRKDISKWEDVEDIYSYFFNDNFASNDTEYQFDAKFDKNDIKELLNRYFKAYDETEEMQDWFSHIKFLGEDIGFASDMKAYKQNPQNYKGNYGEVSSIIRMALTKRSNTPDMYEICKLLGKQEVVNRLQKCINSL